MARTQSEKYPAIRAGILNTAAKLFARKGFATTTIMDLSRACKLSRGALYHYFSSKEEILYCLLKEHLSLLHEEFQQAFDEANDPAERLRAIVSTFVLNNAISRDKQIVLLNDLNQLIPRQQKELVRMQRDLLDLLERAIGAIPNTPKIKSANRRVYTMILLGIINYTFTWYDPKGDVSPQAYAEMTLDTFLNGIGARKR